MIPFLCRWWIHRSEWWQSNVACKENYNSKLISFKEHPRFLSHSLSLSNSDCWQRRKIFRQQIRWKSQRFMMIDGVFYHSSSYIRIRVKIDIIMWLLWQTYSNCFFRVKFMMLYAVLWKILNRKFNDIFWVKFWKQVLWFIFKELNLNNVQQFRLNYLA